MSGKPVDKRTASSNTSVATLGRSSKSTSSKTSIRPPGPAPKVRCAVYTRKSTEEGLEQEFNSLDAQREAGTSYIASQKHEGWYCLDQLYDDGGFSGGTMDRPGLEQLLRDIENNRIDCVVVYKVDRLSRSLLDFSKIMDVFDRNGVSFVSVTQMFNTSTSMGRLVLNVLLSFAQFEREIIGERIRDKIASSKQKGQYTGGTPPLGYNVHPEKTQLIVNPDEAITVQTIFTRYCDTSSPLRVALELNAAGITTKRWVTKGGILHTGRPWDRGHIYRILHNPVYVGRVKHRENIYPGEHEAIIEVDLWDRVVAMLKENALHEEAQKRSLVPSLLKGIISCGYCNRSMCMISTTKDGARFRYYKCIKAVKSGCQACSVGAVPAGDIEGAVIAQLRAVFKSPEIVAKTFRSTRVIETSEITRLESEKACLERGMKRLQDSAAKLINGDLSSNATSTEVLRINSEFIQTQRRLQDTSEELSEMLLEMTTEQNVAKALSDLHPIWDELYPSEQHRIIQLLIEQVTIKLGGMEIRMRTEGVHSLISELQETVDAKTERSR